MEAKKRLPPETICRKEKVSFLSNDAYGVILEGNKEIKIPFSLPGEIVAFNEVKRRRRKDYYFKEIIEKVASRQDPLCQHFSVCGGCMLQHLPKNDYADFKKSIVTSLFVKNGLDPFVIQDPFTIQVDSRRRVNMDVIKKEDGLYLGFHRLKSHAVLNIEECVVLDKDLESILLPLRKAFEQVLELYQKAKIFMTKSDVGIDLSIEIQRVSELSYEQKVVFSNFAKENNICRLMFRYRKKKEVLYQKENPYVLIDGVSVHIDPWSFLQASKQADAYLIEKVLSGLSLDQSLKIADLFCGRGTFTLPLSKKGIVFGYESDPSALDSLSDAIMRARRNINLQKRNLFDDPLSVQELNGFDVVVLDPPRKGAREQCKHLSKSDVATIIYVSCNPETFVLDMCILKENGYDIDVTYILDQFIFTPHLELVSILKKA